MDLNKLFEYSKKIWDDDSVATNVELFLLRKPKNDDVILFSMDINNELQKDLLKIFLDNFRRSEKRKYKQSNYDVVTSGKFDKEYYTTCAKDYNGVDKFIKLFDEEKLDNIKGLDETDFFAYAVKVLMDDEWFIFIAPFAKVSKISATKVIGNLKNEKLTKLENENTVGFSSSISMIIQKNQILMTNNLRHFEKCCGMHSEFKKRAESILGKIAEFDSIEDIEDLMKTIDSDSVIAKRLTKMDQHYDRVASFFENKNEVKKVLEDEAFKEKFKDVKYENGKIKFEKKNRHVFITLISDACYETLVGKTKGIDGGF
ncbi:hypothetical protein CKN63_12420 [Carnobacterium divergens]|uniref:Kiwa anti-phage protein KwaB-like domain-containing protein n=1 Tax=Carnobacterium divergens TaxID=2748 RepID=UPI001072AB25|nr:hypothetical protein [Carnobacterium divergens]TFI61426.1 hypothetical protein CKN59_12845 [Carnobacterium divergens]TFI61704.1 hypothetical protein CKN76_12460 [Carnobacterium divergens]TFI77003.1 hypothetical protein CKN74_13075 [Carnobacterium divergens]TFI93086.1 hypothetical protein CKN61_03310 [Carnobacterium divergens]TFJ00118.1 hypothetical protein CKN75_13505 [Carnobacterium divergens]